MDTVDGLADALAGNVDNLGAIAALDPEMYEDYMQAMVEAGYATQNPDGTYTVDPDKADEFANASVLYIALSIRVRDMTPPRRSRRFMRR